MGCILILISFDPTGISQKIAGQDEPIDYNGFSYIWYENIGKKICIALFASSITTNISEVQKFINVTFKRFRDRGFKPNIKKDLEDEDDDTVNTK
jgi:hypothetical protein